MTFKTRRDRSPNYVEGDDALEGLIECVKNSQPILALLYIQEIAEAVADMVEDFEVRIASLEAELKKSKATTANARAKKTEVAAEQE